MSSNTPKTMSSRLMTMKFMQRSASKAIASSPSTPNGPPSKKMRLSSGKSAPGTPGTPDYMILQSALEEEEKKRQEALDKAAQHTGETKWVLSFHDPLAGKQQEALQVRRAGFAEIDADGDSEDDEEVQPIRKKFGGGVKRKDKPVSFVKTEKSEGEVDSSSEDSSGELDSDDPTAALIQETKREYAAERRKNREFKSQQGKDSRRTSMKEPNGDMSLEGLSSLSGGGGALQCFQCGQKGHVKANCPNSRGSAGRGRGRR